MIVGDNRIPIVSTKLTFSDQIGAWKSRWGVNRMGYRVPAGLYALGSATKDDPVVVTANYKMSFDIVRQALAGHRAWLLVLETFGINVWCAAGKRTFGTDEVIRRIEETGLSQVVSHRKLFLPILGASGVAAHEVERRTGFTVSYATIRANDLADYLNNGMVTTEAMREMTFTFRERLVLIPVELVHALKSLSVIGGILFLTFSLSNNPAFGILALVAFLGAALAGIVIAPVLLPWLPGRNFSVKGALAGIAWLVAYFLLIDLHTVSWFVIGAAFLALPAASAFYTLNFTGCTPFTSRSGVKEEMRSAIPVMGCAVLLGGLLLLTGWLL
jgi:acetyl-CoA decarbonylase/synthase complex subunit gamma